MARQRILYEESKRKQHRKTGQMTMRLPRQKKQQAIRSEETPATASPSSAFDCHSIAERLADIQAIYRSAKKKWVIMTSLGKDSTAALQLIWYAIEALPIEERNNEIYVVCGDTLIEIPHFGARIDATLALINASAQAKQMPISAHKTIPAVNDRLWVCVAGKGYGMPTARFRWCTERLKSLPNEAFVKEHIVQNGQVVMVLGVRSSESATRAASIEKHRVNNVFSRSNTLPGALVYTPLADWTTDDVWTYLLQTPSPWGAENRDLLALYRQASDAGECPIVVGDLGKGQVCGNSRFGCFPCTVSQANRSLANLLGQEEWLEPLWNLYDWLRETTNPDRKLEFRDVNTTPSIVAQNKTRKDGSPIPGRYKTEFRKQLVRRLLEIQRDLRCTSPYPQLTLIDDEQLRAIRYLWWHDGLDDGHYIREIYREITGDELECSPDPAGDAYLLIKPNQPKLCSVHPLQQLLDLDGE